DGREQARHGEKLAGLGVDGGMRIDPIRGEGGGWDVEIVTLDWDEPGLLDKIFEAILLCIHIPAGIAVKRARIFTGARGQVVNLLEFADRAGGQLSEESFAMVLERLRAIRPEERGVLESIENTPFHALIPMVREFPVIDNDRSERYTFIGLTVDNVSNRFTNVLLHFLARSELWLNIQVAEFVQEERGKYNFFVVDKYGRKLTDSHFIRLSLVRVLESINETLMRFNVHYVQREWRMRIDRNEHTIYHNRPDPDGFKADLENIRQMAILKGFDGRLSPLAEYGLLDSKSFFFLKKVEAFVDHNGERIKAVVQHSPAPEEIELCREYFDYRRRALRVLVPLFERLTEMKEISPALSDSQRLEALCHPRPFAPFALDGRYRLYNPDSIWMEEPRRAFDPYILMARTDCYLAPETVDSVEAALEQWTPLFMGKNRAEMGEKWQTLLDESIRQGNTATVLRNMRTVGMLQKFLPGFDHIRGLVHVVSDHAYTVDEHSFIVIEVLEGLNSLDAVMAQAEKSMMHSDYERVADAVGLKNFAEKFVVELRMLQRVTELRRNRAVKPFFQLMDSVRRNSLEYLVEMNVREQGEGICLSALTAVERIRKQLTPLLRAYQALSFSEQRVLVLCGLFHDFKKPAKDHGPRTAEALAEIVSESGMPLGKAELSRLGWLIHHHLDIRPLMKRMGSEGEEALVGFAEQLGDPGLVRDLILFTYADRVAVYRDENKNAHDAMVLSSMLDLLAARGILPRAGTAG
ncbi:MAG: hypothetical protein V3S29_09465, partial [bacterium]